jgi:uncharacterized protein with ParB-like and HNH nuclease domain
MDARKLTIAEFLSFKDTKFIIPVYQRNYDWKKENCQQLFDDIKTIGQSSHHNNHFMGAIVYVASDDTILIDSREYVIIDGQQRITTATLFLKALHDVTTDFDRKVEILEDYLINKRLHDDKNKLKLKPIKKDNEVFTNLLNGNLDYVERNSNIYKNYKFFKDKIQEEHANLDILYRGFKKLVIVHIGLDRQKDNPQLIFESINSTGVSLTQADLIRNFLLMDKAPEEQTQLFEDYWLKIEEYLKSENISQFIRDFLIVKRNKLSNKDDVYSDFKSLVLINRWDTKTLLTEILSYAKIYKTFLFPDDEFYAEYIKNFHQLKFTVTYPFLLSMFYDYHQNKITQDDVISSLKLIESYFIRRMICDKATNIFNKVFSTLYHDIISSQSFEHIKFYEYLATILLNKKGRAIFPSDEDFKLSFIARDCYHIKNIKFLLYKIENYGDKEMINIENLTVEHFMPQTLTANWHIMLGNKSQSIHNKYLHTIGNLSLSAYNSELGNKSFEDKQSILRDNNKLYLNKFFIKVDKWGEEEILYRAKDLFVKAKEIWQYPQHNLKLMTNDDKEFYNLDDEINVTNLKIKSFELLGDRYNVKNWKELWIQVIDKLMDLDESQFRTILNNNASIKNIFSSSVENLRYGEAIREGLYIETSFGANNIINYIKLICGKLGLKEDDFTYII